MPGSPYEEDYEAQTDFAQEGIKLASKKRKVFNDAHMLNRRAHNPSVVQDYFRDDYEAVKPFTQAAFQPWKSDEADFAEEVERAVLNARGEVPWAWFMEQDPDDLLLLNPDVANQVYALQEELAWKKKYEDGIQAQVDQTMRTTGNLRQFMETFNPIAIAGKQLTGEAWDPFDMIDDRSRAEVERAVRDELQATGDVSKPWVMEGIEWLLSGVGTVFSTTVEATFRFHFGGVVENLEQLGVRTPFGIREWQEEQSRAITAAREEAALPDEVLMERLRPMVTEQAWQQVATESPETHQTYMQMAGFDPFLAFSFFSSDLKELPEVEDQLRQIVNDREEGYRQDLNEFVTTLEEQDYRMSAAVMDGLAVYGKYVPMRLASALTILVTDDDAASEALAGRWETFHEQMAIADDSPAKAIGLDGTAVGLLLDLGAGIAFDPTTWIFGPRATSMLGRANSKAGVLQTIDGPLIQRSLDDAVRIAYDDAAGIYEQTYVLNFLDETGHMGDALEVLGGVERTLPARPWIRNDRRALYTQDMNTQSVLKLLDEPAVHAQGNISRQTLDRLEDSIREKGFESALELTYSLRDGTFHMTDGLKRLRAAQEMNLRSVPVTIRLTDTLKRTVQASDGTVMELGPAGVAGNDILEAGEQLARMPASMADVRPNVEGAHYLRPSSMLPKRAILGQDAVTARVELQKIVERAMMDGATPPSAMRLWTAQQWNEKIRRHLNTQEGTDWIRRYMSPQHTITRFELHGPGAMQKLTETVYRIWGMDKAKTELWLGRIYDYQRRLARRTSQYMDETAKLAPEREAVRAMEDMRGGGWDDSLRHLRSEWDAERASIDPDVGRMAELAEQSKQVKANRAQLDEAYFSLSRKAEKDQSLLDQAYADMPNTADLATMIEQMWDDFNRTHIATKKEWAALVDKETGIVPWDRLLRGKARRGTDMAREESRHFIPEELRQIAKADGLPNPEKAIQRLGTVLHNQMAVNVPLSPLDLLVASETGGARWIKISQGQVASDVRETLWTLQKWWVMDKVFRPATAITVSFDELMRIFHIGGARAITEYMKARTDLLAARAQAIVHSKGRRIGVQRGIEHLSPARQARINRYSNFHTQYKQAERQVYEGIGVGYDDIDPTDAIYRDAAPRWFGGLLQDSGFRSYLKGEDAFREWFFGPDGHRLRSATVLDHGTTGLLNRWEDAYQGWQTFFEKIVLKKASDDGRFADVMAAFRKTADEIEAAGGRPVDLPAWVFNHTGAVRGVRKHAPTRMGITRVTDSFFEHTFMNPVNFRRGFMADLIRETELKRLRQLFASQGRPIVSDLEMEHMLKLQGLSGYRDGLRPYMTELAKRNGVIPESYIQDLADSRAMQEIDNVLYTWDQASRFGQQTRVAFPFGKPWADMAGFWGREVLTRPALRGWINNTNFANVNKIANAVVDRMPFNPKPVAMASRLAATDFGVESLTPGIGLPLGAEEADFSPLLFFPTGGDNPFGAIIPGLGFFPMAALDLAVTHMYDPVREPVEYQKLIEDISQFIPSAAYNRGGFIGDMLGGGTTATGIELMADAIGGISGVPFYDVTSQLGDIGREIDRTRELSALLADPEELAELMALTDPEEIDMHLRGMAMEADRRASISHGAATLTRALLPISAQYDTSLEQIQSVWLEAAEKFPEDLRPTHTIDMNTDEGKRQAADSVRRQFFRLPQWKRDLYIAQHPALAVNLVGGWEWTALAENEMGVAQTTYRTGGTPEELAQHQAYIDNRYIRPIQPLPRAHRILGLMQASKEAAAKRIYEFTAQDVNRFLWESVVTPEIKAQLDSIAAGPFGQEQGYTSGQELWANWGRAEAQLEEFAALETGVPMDGEAWDELKASISIPTAQKGWSTSWPGLDDQELSQRFQDLTINEVPPKVAELAAGLGVDITPGMTGLQLFQGVQEVITELDTPLFQMMMPAYLDYVGDRSVESSAWEDAFRKQALNPANDSEWRENVQGFLNYVGNLERRISEDGIRQEPTLAEQQEVVDRFQWLRMTSSDLPVAWDHLWRGRYQRSYGPLEWTPPEPAPVFTEDGEQNPNAYAPYIQRIVDGDTLIVSTAPGAAELADSTFSRPKMHTVRLLGVRAEELFETDGQAAKEQLQDALMEALRTGDRIWLVRDPENTGTNTDRFGRELAWLWIGDNPYSFAEDFRRDEN